MTTPPTITPNGPIRSTITQISIRELWRAKYSFTQTPMEIIGFRDTLDQAGNDRIAVIAENQFFRECVYVDDFLKCYEPILEP